MSSRVLASPPQEEANGAGSVKNKLDVEEKDGSSVEEQNTPYSMNNNSNHTPDGVQELANGSAQSHLEARITDLQNELHERDQELQKLRTDCMKYKTLKDALQANHQKNQAEKESLRSALEQSYAERERESQTHAETKESLNALKKENITIESHTDLLNELQAVKQQVKDLEEMDRNPMQSETKYDVDDVNELNSNDKSVNAINDESSAKLQQMKYQQSVIKRDNLKHENKQYKQLQTNVAKELKKMRAEIMAKDKTISEFDEVKASNAEEIAQLRGQNESLNRSYAVLENEKKKIERAMSSRESQVKNLTRTINEQKHKMSKHDQELQKQRKDFDEILERKNEDIQELKQKQQQLDDKLKNELEKIRVERENRTNLKEQNQRDLNKQKKEVSRQLDKEQEFRITLEHKLQEKMDSLKKKERTIQKLNTSMKQMQIQMESDEKKCIECQNECEQLRKKASDATNSEKIATSQMLTLRNDLNETRARLNKMTDENRVLHDAMRKKDARVKMLEAKENDIDKKLKDVQRMETKAKQELEKAAKIGKKLRQNGSKPRVINSNKRNSLLPRYDPFYQYRNIIPFHWLSIILLFVVFVMYCKANL